MTQSNNGGPSLREYVEGLLRQHEAAHDDHERFHGREHDFSQTAIDKAAELASQNKADANEWRAAMNDRERTFATKTEVAAVIEKADRLDQAEIRRAENERVRLMTEAERKRDDERAQQRSQWLVGVVILVASVMVNLVLRLLAGT